jgi:polyisoprenoid-binding protein YceI
MACANARAWRSLPAAPSVTIQQADFRFSDADTVACLRDFPHHADPMAFTASVTAGALHSPRWIPQWHHSEEITMLLRRLLLTSLIVASTSVLAAPQTFTIDPNHTQVSFTYDHFGFSNPTGRLEDIKGTVVVDQADWAKSSVEVTMPLSGLHTGVPKLDEHLKTPDFFDAAKFPDVTFKSTKVTKTGAGKLDITGDLTVHGVTKPVTLHAHVNKIGENKMIGSQTAGFDADATLKRSEFGMSKYVPMVSDEVHIHITVSADAAK